MSEQVNNVGPIVVRKEGSARFVVNLAIAAEINIIRHGTETVQLEQFEQLDKMVMIVFNQKLLVRFQIRIFKLEFSLLKVKSKNNLNGLEEYERTSQQCWTDCGKKGGKCSVCGEFGYCCRNKYHPSWNGNCPIGAIRAARQDGHDCTQPKG